MGHWKTCCLRQTQLRWPMFRLSFALSSFLTAWRPDAPLPSPHFPEMGDSTTTIFCKKKGLRSFQSSSLMLSWFTKTCDNGALQLPLPTDGGSVVKAYFWSLALLPTKTPPSLQSVGTACVYPAVSILPSPALVLDLPYLLKSWEYFLSRHMFQRGFRWSPQTCTFAVFDKWLRWLCK